MSGFCDFEVRCTVLVIKDQSQTGKLNVLNVTSLPKVLGTAFTYAPQNWLVPKESWKGEYQLHSISMETYSVKQTSTSTLATGERGTFPIEESDVLSGKSSKYQIEKFLGEGSFGKVAQCIKLDTKEKMAVKIVRQDISWAGKKEVAMLKKLRKLDQEKNNLVRLKEHFMHRGHVCLAFEMLDINLYDMMKARSFKMRLCEIRIITRQMLDALNALKSIGLAHTDIKPDNIMLVNHQLQPFKLKLIDFGLASVVSTMWRGVIIQPLGYRAPEVLLGLPLNEAVDMWALGCVLAFMYLGQHLYPLQCEYEVMRVIVQMHGQPDDHLLNSGISTRDYFSKNQPSLSPSWRLNTRAEYKLATGSMTKHCKGVFDMFTCLDDMAKTKKGVEDATDYEDTQAFLDLLKQMLHVDPEKRITPSEALEHHFITMKHPCIGTYNDSYVTSPRLTTKDCRLEQSSKYFETTEVISWNGASITSLDDTLSVDEETTAGNNDEPPGTARLDETAAAGPTYRTPATADRTAAGNNDDPLSVDEETAAGNNDGPPATTRLDETAAAGPTYRTPATADRTAAGNNDDPLSVDEETAAGNNDEPPGTARLDETAAAGPNYRTPATAGRTAAGNNDDPPGTAGLDDANAAGTDEKPPGTTKASSPASVIHNSYEVNANGNEGTTHFVEIKSRKKWLKRIQRFFSRMIKSISCCSVDVAEQRHTTFE
ncbi:homeodomain-interacting protein kinase 2-like [Siniperca chuatsi]|uniref:homeodomain-interacting protein kinase 2-like n=1 Tax=Siniperca chuatsi TaxID=119488 RepID=UPI001CE0A610|nr:homeodomain-interacting protein kinase 2-like [Siniperca chuatsi]